MNRHEMKGIVGRWGIIGAGLLGCALFASFAAAQGNSGGAPGLDRAEDRIEEDVPGRPDLVKVTHIFRDNNKGRGKPPAAACACDSPEGASYSFEKVKWAEASLPYTIYTLNSGAGALAGDAIRASFSAWKLAEPSAPDAVATQNDTGPGPGIALDEEQNVSWRSLSADYGSNTLAVTVYWYTRAKLGGFSKAVHFDMAFNTDYSWAVLSALNSCGGAGASAFDIQNVGTHEAGHVYGLGHNSACNLTMNPTAAPEETSKVTLGIGDAEGIRALY